MASRKTDFLCTLIILYDRARQMSIVAVLTPVDYHLTLTSIVLNTLPTAAHL